MTDQLEEFYDGTRHFRGETRTTPFTEAEFSNVWAVNRGNMFGIHDLRPFHIEFQDWLFKVKAAVWDDCYATGRGEPGYVIRDPNNPYTT